MLKNAGASIVLNIEMPGEISSASVGTIASDKKKVSIDLLTDMDTFNQGVTVVSEEANLVPIIIAIVALLIIAACTAFFLLKKKPVTTPANPPAAQS
jgi:hypothetical protein